MQDTICESKVLAVMELSGVYSHNTPLINMTILISCTRNCINIVLYILYFSVTSVIFLSLKPCMLDSMLKGRHVRMVSALIVVMDGYNNYYA